MQDRGKEVQKRSSSMRCVAMPYTYVSAHSRHSTRKHQILRTRRWQMPEGDHGIRVVLQKGLCTPRKHDHVAIET